MSFGFIHLKIQKIRGNDNAVCMVRFCQGRDASAPKVISVHGSKSVTPLPPPLKKKRKIYFLGKNSEQLVKNQEFYADMCS